MRAELDIMITKTANGCSLQVVELITVLKYSTSTDLLFRKNSRPVCAKWVHNILFQLCLTILIFEFCFLLWRVKHLKCNLLKHFSWLFKTPNIFLILQFQEREVFDIVWLVNILELRERRWARAQKNNNEMALFTVTLGLMGSCQCLGSSVLEVISGVLNCSEHLIPIKCNCWLACQC